MLYTDDVDATFKSAVAAGAKTEQPPTDMFWGDRMANMTRIRSGTTGPSPRTRKMCRGEEMEKRMQMQGA